MSFVFKVVPGPLFEENKSALEALMIRLLHPRATMQWEIVSDIPPAKSGKAHYFVKEF
jgi:hypothetical protein